jgi:GNAT superfamily N-acetyltransferase
VFTIRPATGDDETFLFEMLYEALFVPPGAEPLPRSILDEPKIAHYVAGFGTRAGDLGFVAEAADEPIGAVWVRLFPSHDRGYGYVDDDTPELTVAVVERWRAKGVGAALVARLIDDVPRMSLSCDTRNPAMRMYRRLGFDTIAVEGNSITMLRGT